MSKYYIESNGIWKGKHQLSWAELCDELRQLEKENEQLKSVLFNTVGNSGANKMVVLLNKQDQRIKELESELELYKHHAEFIPSSEW